MVVTSQLRAFVTSMVVTSQLRAFVTFKVFTARLFDIASEAPLTSFPGLSFTLFVKSLYHMSVFCLQPPRGGQQIMLPFMFICFFPGDCLFQYSTNCTAVTLYPFVSYPCFDGGTTQLDNQSSGMALFWILQLYSLLSTSISVSECASVFTLNVVGTGCSSLF